MITNHQNLHPTLTRMRVLFPVPGALDSANALYEMRPLLLAIHRTTVGFEVANPVIVKATVQTNAHANFYVHNVATNTSPLIAPRMIANLFVGSVAYKGMLGLLQAYLTCRDCDGRGHMRRDCPQRQWNAPIAWIMDTPEDNVINQICQNFQGAHTTALCRVHEQKPDKKHNALSVPVATNYNRTAPSINAFRNQAFYGQENQHGQFNDGNGGDNGWKHLAS
ncbi:hypothetical protein FNAPI_12852 [Fusarium napiforme]|uniref:CCHC-type domain-containing protein n=1 Tax=Fusarium napiforme TaxID=42672 RepID=A0A8H5MLA3_9HYPO|nr:hypothetical protein FNAPI_12852 [Fusarium napiforme]